MKRRNTVAGLTLMALLCMTLSSCDWIMRLFDRTQQVIYDANGAISGTVPVDQNEYEDTDLVTVLDNVGTLTRHDHRFTGWNTAPNGSGGHYDAGDTFMMGSDDVVLYAEWDAWTTYTVTYHPNGAASGSVPVDPTAYLEGDSATVAGNIGGLEQTGYEFSGWNTVATGVGDTYQPGDTIVIGTESIDLYAIWEEPGYTVTYDPNGAHSGTVPIDSTVYLTSDIVTVLGNTGSLYRYAHTFAGWNTDSGGAGVPYDENDTFAMGTEDVTLYAQWTLLPMYHVTYHENGGTGNDAPVDSTNYLSGETAVILGNTTGLAVTESSFVGWDTDPAGAGVHYAPGDEYMFGSADLQLYAQWAEYAFVPDSDPGPADHFGFTMAVDGDYMVAGVDRGTAQVFRRTGDNEWTASAELNCGEPLSNLVAINGDYAVVGAIGDDAGGTDAGAAWIFHRTGVDTWDSGVKIVATDPDDDDLFGWAVDISGDYVIVGAYHDDELGNNAGAAYIFHRTGASGVNEWDSGVKLTAGDPGIGDFFGWSVSIDGDIAVVGAHRETTGGTSAGAAYVFERSGTNTWDTGTKLTASDAAEYDHFGYDVAVSGSTIVVGAYGHDAVYGQIVYGAAGLAYVFERVAFQNWDETANLYRSGDPFSFEEDISFGWSVAACDEYIVVGAPGYDMAGAAYLFRQSVAGSWVLVTWLDFVSGDMAFFGNDVAVSDGFVVCNAPGLNAPLQDSGAVYVMVLE